MSEKTAKSRQRKYIRVKFAGVFTLVMMIVAIFFAAAGQLDIFAAKDTLTGPVGVETSKNQPKYEFTEKLNRRINQIDREKSRQQKPTTKIQQHSSSASDNVQKNASARYVVQVAAFANEAAANEYKSDIVILGFPARVVRPNNMFLVQAGPFIGRDKAEEMENKLKHHHIQDTLIKRLK